MTFRLPTDAVATHIRCCSDETMTRKNLLDAESLSVAETYQRSLMISGHILINPLVIISTGTAASPFVTC